MLAGNSLKWVKPAARPAISSVAVATPGRSGAAPPAVSPSIRPGLTQNSAPTAAQARRVAPFSTVPAPTTAPSTSAAMRSMQSIATGVRRVISRTGRPPATRARPSGTAWASSSMIRTGMTGASRRISSIVRDSESRSIKASSRAAPMIAG